MVLLVLRSIKWSVINLKMLLKRVQDLQHMNTMENMYMKLAVVVEVVIFD
jgi:hypothetical protein